MQIIESRSDFNTFLKKFRGQSSILLPIYVDSRQHVNTNRLCLMGVCEMYSGEITILPFDHPEVTNLPPELVANLADGLELWTPDRKILSYLPLDRPLWEPSGDIQSLEYLSTGKVTPASEFYPAVIKQTHERHYSDVGVNQAIPFYKWAEFIEKYCEHLRKIVLECGEQSLERGYDFLMGVAIPSLQWIEESGLHVDTETLRKHFAVDDRFITNGLVHSEYNLFTATGRPSCTFGGINFAALNKENGERASFNSRFKDGMLVNIDFESYHVRLIANHLGYDLPEIPAHEYFGKYYFGTDSLTPEQYEESKIRTFKLLYSNQPSNIPFFAKVKDFKDQMWDEMQTKGYVLSPIFGKKIMLDQIWEPRPAKVFNYFVQFMETEQNLVALAQLQKMFERKDSKIILYNYDSFLIDFSMADGGVLLLDMISYLEQDKKFPVRVKYGKTFSEMKELNLNNI